MRISNHYNDTHSDDAEQESEHLPSALEPTQRLDDVRKFGFFPS